MRFKRFLIFEYQRLLNIRNICLFLLLLVFSVYLLQSAIVGRKDFLKDSKKFQRTEQKKIELVHNYTAYGYMGFRVLFIPPDINVFFDSTSMDKKMATVYSGPHLDFYNIHHGKQLFSNKEHKNVSFSNIVIMFLTAFCLFYGWESFSKPDLNKFLSKLVAGNGSRFLLILIIVLFFSAVGLFGLLINGFKIDLSIFLIYSFLVYSVCLFFYSIGTVASLIKSKSVVIIILAVVWFISILFLPSVIGHVTAKHADNINSLFDLEILKIKILADFERKALKISNRYEQRSGRKEVEARLMRESLNNEYKQIENEEISIINQMKSVQRFNDSFASFFPTGFFYFTVDEISGNGYKSHIKYFEYAIKLKAGFLEFYVDEKIKNNYGPVQSFIKDNGNLFLSKSRLPGYFIQGIALTLFYTAVLFLIGVMVHSKKLRSGQVEGKRYKIEFPKGKNSVFVLCENDQAKREIVRYYEQQKNAACLEKVTTADFRIDLKPWGMVKHFCRILGVEEKKVIEYLEIIGIEDVKRLKKLSHETILKIYVAVKTAAASEYIVLNDFLKGVSREFEKQMFQLLEHLKMNGVKVIFLSCEMFETVENFMEKMKFDICGVLPVPPTKKVTFR